MDKADKLMELYEPYMDCERCQLCAERLQVVPGYGNPDSPIMFIGIGPGAEEDETGIPFIGQAGQTFMTMLAMVTDHPDFDRYDELSPRQIDELYEEMRSTFYFTNVVLCRPPENRDPSRDEVAACLPRLLEEIYIVDPAIIVCVGSVPWKAVSKQKKNITNARGTFYKVMLPGKVPELDGNPGEVARSVLPTFHPSFIDRRDPDFNGFLSAQFANDLADAVRAADMWKYLTQGKELPDRAEIVGVT